MTTQRAVTDQYAKARRQTEESFRDHELSVLHEDGVYRHLRFARPKTWMYGFDLVTWPGHLAIDGDIGAGFVFARLHDMVDFFASGPDINPGYWSEKISNPTAREGTRVYSRERLDAMVKDALIARADDAAELFKLQAAWREHTLYVELEDEYPAPRGVARLRAHPRVEDLPPVEWDLKDWDHHFLLTCFAIRHGVALYRARVAVAA